jgi:gamma-glutamyltranspeptidase
MLGMLARFDLSGEGGWTPRSAHLFAEAGRLAFADQSDDYHQFVARKISEYIDFKYSRKPAEDHLVDRRIVGTRGTKP